MGENEIERKREVERDREIDRGERRPTVINRFARYIAAEQMQIVLKRHELIDKSVFIHKIREYY